MNSNSPELIPVADVTEDELTAERDQLHTEVSPIVQEILDSKRPFLMIALREEPGKPDMLQPVAFCKDNQIEPMVAAAISLVGYSILGRAVETMPPELVPHMVLSAGLAHLNKTIQSNAQAALNPATPAGDIGAHGEDGRKDSVH